MKSRDLAAAAIFVALTFVVTRYTVIPIPATKGYFNLGEVVIYIAALAFGPLVGLLAGGVGSALADLAAAPQFAPFTLVIKGIEGYLVGRLAGPTTPLRLRATVLGGAWMVAGYFAAETLFARFLGIAPTPATAVAAALTEVPFNIVQVTAGVVVAVLVAVRLVPLMAEKPR
ncbi:MAG: ECF transporter S component [Armatimonadota bacterium]|nr:ECF transporter S component [Armatimonadota bacterium]MDR7426768.1 ECF transporter S component [Armatimonadota bacterium]MDR7465000.1 ECF transporter S component [Armatimonadota bacterium]MDR7469858.1 ECF transporter S component [Armatimonadota bacterium]MDR7474318.1 ECF transporter S component [Armatimonadota bacterium]